MKAKPIKKIIRYIINAISIIIVLLAVTVMVRIIFSPKDNIPDIMGYSLLRVLTGSMEPEIPENSLIVVEHKEADAIQVGDVISFYSADPQLDGMVNTHRVAAIEQQGDNYTIHTKGDANAAEDEYTTDEKHLIGCVVWMNHPLGVAVRLISNPLLFVPIIIAPLVLILLYHIRQVIVTTKQISKEQEEAYQRELQKIIEKKRQNKKKS